MKQPITPDHVVLVDENDKQLGTMEKMDAHRKGLLHRAFSIFIFDKKKRMLLQKRALSKYHSGGLWTNSCCSHPRKEETVLQAAHRRLFEELGFDVELHKVFDFIYRADLDKGLTEHEFDHVIVGTYNEEKIDPNPEEVEEVRFISLSDLRIEMQKSPENFTVWFKIALERVLNSSKLSIT